MSARRVIAYFMHEYEMAAAHALMPTADATDSYLIGSIDETLIDKLKQKGLIVQVLEEPPAVESLEVFSALHGEAKALATSVGMMGEPTPVQPTHLPDMNSRQFFLVWIQGPVLETWKKLFESIGVQLLEAFPTGAYKVRLDPLQVGLLKSLPFVAGLRLYSQRDTGPTPALPVAAALSQDQVALTTFDILLHRSDDAQIVLNWLKSKNVSVAGSSGRKIRVYLLANSPLLFDIPDLPEVAAFEEYVLPKLHNDRARQILRIDAAIPGSGISQTGSGQIVGIADTGIDDQHPDLLNRIMGMTAWGRPGNTSDPNGHGTHVSGSVAGDGSASAGSLRGTAPDAKIFFQSLLDPKGGLGGLPLDLALLFDEAYKRGARIHNNSWGAAMASRYTINSCEVDDFVASHRDMLIVVSAGNEGTASPRANSAKGHVDWLSIGSPASCKNALTVGASRSDRIQGGFSQLTHGGAWPAQFPDPPIAAEPVSGNSDCIAGFSSRGPCDDRRIKPDLVAPGTDIASTRSQLAPLSHFWGTYPGNGLYAFWGGTSMSAPLVSGCAALVRQYLQEDRNHNPSAALLKALLVAGTQWLPGWDANAPALGSPNFHQGFGRISMMDTLPNPSRPNLRVEFEDNWQQGAQKFAVTGQRVRFQFNVQALSSSLRICLAYTDLPARALQNNLNLFVQRPDGSKLMGNEALPNGLNIPDPDNNVELVRIDNPDVGTYLIQITASNLLKGPQDYALVVLGENISPLVGI